MKIRLLDYAGTPTFVEIPDDTDTIEIKVVTGDMIMTSPVYKDSSNSRMMGFYDGEVTLTRDQFHYLDEIETSYELFDKLDENE